MSDLILLRGLPGSGKSTLAQVVAPFHNVAADDYFDSFRDGVFDARLIGVAHRWCRERTCTWMQNDAPIIAVHNTFTRQSEMTEYFALAEEFGYRIHTLIVENRHGGQNVHEVPPETVDKMKKRFQVQLKGESDE